MDVSMPDVDGFELADTIRQHPRFQKTAIIFVSAVSMFPSRDFNSAIAASSPDAKIAGTPSAPA